MILSTSHFLHKPARKGKEYKSNKFEKVVIQWSLALYSFTPALLAVGNWRDVFIT